MVGKKYVLFHSPGSTDATFFDENSRDNCCEPFLALRKRCAELGYALETTAGQPLDACERIVFWDVSSVGLTPPARRALPRLRSRRSRPSVRDIYAEARAAGLADRLALILAEPPSICAENGDVAVHELFSRVFTWKAALLTGSRYVRMYLPVTAVYPHIDEVPFSAKKLLVDISGNKTSPHPRELYSERRATIAFFDSNYPADFDLYGVGWNVAQRASRRFGLRRAATAEMFGTYKGTIRHKWDVLPQYRFNICYENMRDEPDYVSQRIFDVLRCGCVPIYWGAPNIEEYVDREAFVDRRAFASNDELARYLSDMGEADYRRIVEAGRDYLASEKFKLFLSPHFVETMVGALGLA